MGNPADTGYHHGFELWHWFGKYHSNIAMRFRRGTAVITELTTQEKVIGVKQSRKAIREGRATQVYLACDADPAITEPLEQSCREAGIPVDCEHTMAQLGQACRITVGASVVALLATPVFPE